MPCDTGLATPWNANSNAASEQSPAASRQPAGDNWKAKQQSRHYGRTWHDYSCKRAPAWRSRASRRRSVMPATDSAANWPRGGAADAALAPRRANHDTSGPNQYSGPIEDWNPQQDNWAPPRGPTAPRTSPPWASPLDPPGRHANWQSNGEGSNGTSCTEAPRREPNCWT